MDRLKQIKSFALVAKHGSFTGAAEELAKPVQTVSKNVRHLEEELGVLLFDRTTRSVSLTDIGRAYLERAEDLVEQFEDLDASVRDEHGAPKGRIRLTASTSFGEKRLVPVLAEFLRSYPEIELELTLTNDRVSLIDEGIDVALRIGQMRDSSFIVRRLADMRVVTVASPDFLAQWGTPKSPSDLATMPCIVDTNYSNPETWPYLVTPGSGQVERVAIKSRIRANSPEANRHMAVTGIGIALCPMYVVNQDLINGTLVPLFEDLEAHDFCVHALYPHRRHLTARVRVLLDHLETHFRLL